MIEFEFDEAKSLINKEKHGIDFFCSARNVAYAATAYHLIFSLQENWRRQMADDWPHQNKTMDCRGYAARGKD